jgi:hypothetical protein
MAKPNNPHLSGYAAKKQIPISNVSNAFERAGFISLKFSVL